MPANRSATIIGVRHKPIFQLGYLCIALCSCATSVSEIEARRVSVYEEAPGFHLGPRDEHECSDRERVVGVLSCSWFHFKSIVRFIATFIYVNLRLMPRAKAPHPVYMRLRCVLLGYVEAGALTSAIG